MVGMYMLVYKEERDTDPQYSTLLLSFCSDTHYPIMSSSCTAHFFIYFWNEKAAIAFNLNSRFGFGSSKIICHFDG